MFDSLIEKDKKDKYSEVLSKSTVFTNASTALATIIGGYLFNIWGGLPFLLTGLAKFIALGLALRTTEPKVDTFKFSLNTFIVQNLQGFRHLLSKGRLPDSMLIILMGGFGTIAYEILDDVAVVNWGYSATGISWLYTVSLLLCIPFGLAYKHIVNRVRPIYLVTIGIVFLVINYLISPFINVIIWTFLFYLRDMFSPIKDAAINDIINNEVTSSIRATTLSTYQLIIKLPYAIFGLLIGNYMEWYGVKKFSTLFALLLLGMLIIYWLVRSLFVNEDNQIEVSHG